LARKAIGTERLLGASPDVAELARFSYFADAESEV
jgi:hypothetical protein